MQERGFAPHTCPPTLYSINSKKLIITSVCVVPGLKKFLKKNVVGDTLAVLDAKLGAVIKEKLEINCIHKCVITIVY